MEIDRENSHLIRKMSEAMKKPSAYQRTGRSGPASLNRDGRKAELLRITKDNERLLQAIHKVQPVYSAHKWESNFKNSERLLRNCSAYPVITRMSKSRSEGSVMLPLEGADDGAAGSLAGTARGSFSGGPSPRKAEDAEGVVLKEGKRIGSTYYLLEMSTDGRTLTISAYDGQTQTSLELVVKESKHRQLYRDTNGDYSRIASLLRVDGDRLVLHDVNLPTG